MNIRRWHTTVVFDFLVGLLAMALPAQAEEKEIRVESDIVYGKGDETELRLNLALPTGQGPFPTASGGRLRLLRRF